jgi:hypothetical protein
VPSSLPPPLHAALAAVAERLDGAGVDWVVSGSAGLALAGFAIVPRDLDIEVEADDAPAAAAAVGLVAARETDARVSSVRARGAWDGVELDITGGLEFHGPGGNLLADFRILLVSSTAVDVAGRTVRVAPVEEHIARSIVAGDAARLDRLADGRPKGYLVNEVYLSRRLASAAL